MNRLTPHQFKALNTKGHLALTANAGSGKTFVLARKYLSVLLNGNAEVSNVAAITFTDKAAGELYNKISVLIDEQIAESTYDGVIKKKLEKIRRQLVSANISTIHSFCIDILREFPVEAQLDARFIPMDEKLSGELIELSVEEMIRASFDDELVTEDLKYLIRIFSSKRKLQTQLEKLIGNRKNVFAVKEKIYSLDEQQIEKYFFETFIGNFLKIWNKTKTEFTANLAEINSTVMKNDSKNQIGIEVQYNLNKLQIESSVESIIKLITEIKELVFTDKYTIRKKGYLKNELHQSLAKQIKEAQLQIKELSEFKLPINHAEIELELAKFGKVLISFFDYALKAFEAKKKNDGLIDFEDILLHTKVLLANKNVQQSLAERFKFIMVDEFQDTNEIQYQIFLPILDYLKSGKLFIVGDEKQSIYKFRDAEIEIFNSTRNDIRIAEGENNLLVLPDSFRMTPAICVFCNHLFKNLFSFPDENYGEVPATDLVCARVDDKKGKVEFLISRKDDVSKAITGDELVAKKILQIVEQKNYSLKDITILVRKRKYFAELEKTFLQYKIPFTIVGGRGFYQRQTISDILNYISFLTDENNSPALVGLLRSPFFTISDSKLFEISLQKGRSFWKKLLNTRKADENINSVCKILEENLLLSSSVNLPYLIKKIISDKDYLYIIASRKDGEQEIANIDKLIAIARNFNAMGFRNLYDFLTFLKDSIANLADEAQASIASEMDAVQLMTIHQSKGLEFPIVFLYKTDDEGISNNVKSKEVQVNKNIGLLTKVPVNQNYFDDYLSAPIIAVHNYLEKKKNIAELKRLLYVAVTRAKDELYITLTTEKDKQFNYDSFLNLLSIGLNSDFTENKIIINDELEYLININNGFENRKENMRLEISIISEIEFLTIAVDKKASSNSQVEINTGLIKSVEKGEIISASKVSIYNQCPMKYFLTYEYGFGKLNSDYKNYSSQLNKNLLSEDYENDEDEQSGRYETFDEKKIGFNSAMYGKLFHSFMEKYSNPASIDEFINTVKNSGVFDAEPYEIYATKLKSDVNLFFNSAAGSEIASFPNYKNEYEIYVKEKDYYLHGIIDKIIFDGTKIIIIDYKTDEIEQNQISEHAQYYLMQLKFYLYIASRLLRDFEKYEGNLLFIKHPDNPVRISFDKSQIGGLEKEITGIINSIANKVLDKNIKHCKVCSYSGLASKCIIN